MSMISIYTVIVVIPNVLRSTTVSELHSLWENRSQHNYYQMTYQILLTLGALNRFVPILKVIIYLRLISLVRFNYN